MTREGGKIRWINILIAATFANLVSSNVVPSKYELEQEWADGFLAKISIPISQRYSHGWLLYIKYESSVADLDVFEAELIDAHPNNKEYVFRNKDYNTVVYYYKDKIFHLYLQGNQYPSRDKSIYKPPPDAEVIFVAYLTPTETVAQALKRVDELPADQRKPVDLKGTTTTTTTTSTEQTTVQRTTTTTTTRLPWLGWQTPAVNILQTTTTTTTQQPTTTRRTPSIIAKKFRHNLREVIKKSLLFYEAQKSGYLPITKRVMWRSHSALRDGSDKGIDLTGGYYVDGGHVKYGFPTAATLSLLAWGAIEFKRGYVASKELGNLLATIKWGTDYLLKCHTSPNEFYGQVSDSDSDNAVWGRPEDMRGVRPSYAITRNRPGSDLAAESAAALAAASIVLKNTNPIYSEKLVNHSISLFRFADRYRAKYDKSISDANIKYSSSGYFDEIAWAAGWLYGVTTKPEYLEIAVRRLAQSENKPIKLLDWNDKRIAVVALLAQMTNRTEYRLKLLEFCDSMLVGGSFNYTHKGLLYISDRDTTSLASNSAFICLFAANLGIRTEVYRRFAQQQLNYILGDNGQSFVVGYGKKSPKRPFHKASSCPQSPKRCSWQNRDSNTDNPIELTGALVSGPDIWDNYVDNRNSYSNRISIYNNAGFQTLAAGILQIQVAMQTFSDPEPGELMPAILPKFDKHQDYGQVLRYSNMFYEAQRSGRLPFNTRISWRKSACVNDKSDNGIDLSGGFFDGADYIKFNFPMAFSTTVLAWGMIAFPKSYIGAGEADALRSILRWSTDYFIKCHSSKYEFYGQVGFSAFEHSYWLRPEDINYPRPAFKISKKYPGSELAAEAAAAMAATATIFWPVNEKYATLLVKHAKELYQFADQYRGMYHRSIPDAARFYPSYNGYKDELVWASIWLYLATNKTSFLTEATSKYEQFRMSKYSAQDFYWDDKLAGINVLLAKITGKKVYVTQAKKFCDMMIQNGKFTSKGLLYRRPWGPFQYSSGVALICLLTADLGVKSKEYRKFAKKQIHYILGESGSGSFVVGYGPTPPKQPYHRASSCPAPPNPCNFTALYSKLSNPHTLYGAVVGGPDRRDIYVDDRTNTRSNTVNIAYNAAFQSAVAGLRNLEIVPPATKAPRTKKPKKKKPKNDKKLNKPNVKGSKNSNVEIQSPTQSTTSSNIVSSQPHSVPTTNSAHSSATKSVIALESSTNTTTMKQTTLFLTTNTTPTVSEGTRAFDYMQTSANASNSSLLVSPTVNIIFNASTQSSSSHSLGTHIHQARTNAADSLLTLGTSLSIVNSTTDQNQVSSVVSDASVTILSTKTANDTRNWQKTRYCGRQRALELFDACVIPTNKFHAHPDSRIYRCRYLAFKSCVGVQSDNCIDGVWTYWPYWNHNANDRTFFTVEDIHCKDQRTLDIENCEIAGMTGIFQECYKKVKAWNATRKERDCRWVVFGTCVSKKLDHCKRTWKMWELWNMGLPVEEQFTEDEMDCSENSAAQSTVSWIFYLFFFAFVRYIHDFH